MPTTRRALFRLLPPTWLAYAQALKAADSTESYWQLIKREFPLDESLVYLNAANVCPASRLVLDRYQHFLRDFHANPSFQNREKYVPLEDRLRGKIAHLLSVTPDEIALTRNTSEGSNLVVRGLDLKPGDEILITSHNHPSNNDSWKVRARRDGLKVVTVEVPVPAISSAALVESIRAAITSRTRVVAITHVTSTTGIRFPAREIAALARERGLWMHLDGAQSFGAIDVNLRDIGCDSFPPARTNGRWVPSKPACCTSGPRGTRSFGHPSSPPVGQTRSPVPANSKSSASVTTRAWSLLNRPSTSSR